MIRRFLRYTSLLLCLLLIAAWGWSYVYVSQVKYRAETASGTEWTICIQCGGVGLSHMTGLGRVVSGFTFENGRLYYLPLPSRLGLRMPDVKEFEIADLGLRCKFVTIPFWLIVTPLLPITAWLWIPWIRERRKKRGVGFEVEAKPAEAKSE